MINDTNYLAENVIKFGERLTVVVYFVRNYVKICPEFTI